RPQAQARWSPATPHASAALVHARHRLERKASCARFLIHTALVQTLQPGFHGTFIIQIGRKQCAHAFTAHSLGATQQWLQILDSVPAPQEQRAGLFQIDQASLPAPVLFAQADMFGVETAVYLPSLMEVARQLADRANDCCLARRIQLRPSSQAAVKVFPPIQCACQKNRPLLTCKLAAAEKACLQSRNAQLLIALDIAELAGKGRLAQGAQQAAGQVIALALEVVGALSQLQPENTAPATALNIRLIHSLQLERPQRVKA